MSRATTSISFRFSASVSEYDAASLTAFTASSTGRPRGSVTERRSAETSSPTFFAIVFGRSSPPPPTGDAAPAFVPGAIAATSHDMRTMKPAEAACDPGGATQPTTGTGEPRIACVIARVESSRPPCVSMRRMTSGASGFSRLLDRLRDEARADGVDLGVEVDDRNRRGWRRGWRRAPGREGREQKQCRPGAHGGIIGSC